MEPGGALRSSGSRIGLGGRFSSHAKDIVKPVGASLRSFSGAENLSGSLRRPLGLD